LHVVSFILGSLGASAIVVGAALGAGFSGWPAVGLGAACFFLAQALYLVWLAGMARAEARRRNAKHGGSDVPGSVKPDSGVVQKG
jgi:hypothetical protein